MSGIHYVYLTLIAVACVLWLMATFSSGEKQGGFIAAGLFFIGVVVFIDRYLLFRFGG